MSWLHSYRPPGEPAQNAGPHLSNYRLYDSPAGVVAFGMGRCMGVWRVRARVPFAKKVK